MATLDFERIPERHNAHFNRAVVDLRHEFNGFIDGLAAGASGALEWELSSLASRSPFVSPLFFACCRLDCLEKLLPEGGFDAVMVGAPGMKAVLDAFFEGQGSKVRVELRRPWGAGLARVLKPWGRLLKTACQFLRERRAFGGLPLPTPEEPVTLLDMFLLEDSFRDGAYRDRYYPGLLNSLTPDERKGIYFLPEFHEAADEPEVIAKARASGEPFLFKGRFLKAADWLAALAFPLKLRSLPLGSTCFRGFDLAPIIREEIRDLAWNAMTMRAFLNHRFARRLREAGVRVRFVLDWFENQLLDRGLNLGFKEFYPDVPVVGYCGVVISPLRHLHLRPTARERRAGAVPPRLAVMGRGLIEEAKEFCRDLEVVAAPAFRFQSVWRERPRPPAGERFNVLVPLPLNLETSSEILEILRETGRAGLAGRSDFLVKPHPAIPVERIRPLLAEGLQLSTADFGALTERADLVVGNTTSACVEALAMGIPVVVLASRRGVTENPIPGSVSREIWRPAADGKELLAAMEELLTRDEGRLRRYQELGRQVREDYFEPVDPDRVRRLLGLSAAS